MHRSRRSASSFLHALIARLSVLRSSRLALLIVLAAATAGACIAVPALAGAAKHSPHPRHAATHGTRPRGSTYHRLARLRAFGRRAPRGTHHAVHGVPGREVASLRNADSRTYARPDGTYVTRIAPTAVNFRDSRGHWQPINNRLVAAGAANARQGFALENAANSYKAFLPRNLKTETRVAAAGSWVSIRLLGARGAGRAAGVTDRYANALPGVDAAYTATNSGLKETLTLHGARSTSNFTYVIHASSDVKARRMANGAIAFAKGRRPLFVLPAPFVYDSSSGASHDPSFRAVTQRLARTVSGYRLQVRVKPSWLAEKGRQFPVTVDPSVYHIENTGDTRLRTQGADQDCYIKDGSFASTSSCGLVNIDLGWHTSTQRRMLLQFNVQNSLPKGIHVLDAELDMHVFAETGSGSSNVELHRLTRSWTTGATWNAYDGTNQWASAGGDYDSTVAASSTVGGVGWYQWYPRQLVQGWIDGSIPNYGVLVKQATERSLDNDYEFESSSHATTANRPYLDVVYEPQTGQRPYYKFESQQLNDRMDLNVNVASGNLLLHANDANVNGTGLDLGVDRFYNSQLERTTDFGQAAGWLLGSGADVHLRLTSDSAVFYAPSGYVVSFQKNAGGNTYTPPPGIDATLCKVGTGCVGESTYALTYNHAQIRNNFDASGKLVSQRDQNGNTISFGYDASGHLNSITDTQGRTYAVTTNTSGYISEIDEPAPSLRKWQYGYDASNRLTSYTDPEGKITSYKYDAAGELHEVDDPRGGVTWIWYDTNADQRVTKVQRVNDNGGDDIIQFAYSGPSSPCQSSDFGKTVVTDANNHTTTYCYDQDGKVKTVFDGKTPANKQQTGYDSSSFVQTYTSANNATSGFNTTVGRDPVSHSVKTITQATGTSTNLQSSFGYDTNSSAPYAPFYPNAATNTQGHTESYFYDGNGNPTITKDDLSPTPRQTTASYDPGHPGWLAQIKDANGNVTTYGHDALGNINSIAPPTVTNGPGPTLVSYDSLSRPCVVTDGKTQKTAYSYDKLDRVKTIAKYNAGTTSTGCTVNGTATATVSFTYDANGNLTQRVDPVGTTSYAYNALNRLNSQTYPSGRSNTYTYDPVGNLKTLADGGGTTTYGYDEDNLLSSLTEPGGSCTAPVAHCITFTTDGDGNRLKTTYPNGIVLTNAYDAADRLTCTMATSGAPSQTCDLQASPLRRYKYGYVSGGKDTALRQSVTDQAGNVTTYTYDNLDRLTAATTQQTGGSITDDYHYTPDNVGNILSVTAKANSGSTTTTTYTYNAANELCWSISGSSSNDCAHTPAGATTYQFDKNGNETSTNAGQSFGYNVFDQMISYNGPGAGGASTLTYLGPNQDEVATIGNSSGTNQYQDNVLGESVRIASSATYYERDNDGQLLGQRDSTGDYYPIPDGLGSIMALTNSSGTIANTYKYDPYGKIVTSTGTAANVWNFAGGRNYFTGDLYHFGMRMLDPNRGRWTQPDPIDQTGDLRQGNRYLYSGADPVNHVDRIGLCSDPGDCAAAAGATIIGGVATAGAAVGTALVTGACVDQGGGPDCGEVAVWGWGITSSAAAATGLSFHHLISGHRQSPPGDYNTPRESCRISGTCQA